MIENVHVAITLYFQAIVCYNFVSKSKILENKKIKNDLNLTVCFCVSLQDT